MDGSQRNKRGSPSTEGDPLLYLYAILLGVLFLPGAGRGVTLILGVYLDAADKRGLLPMFYLELVSGLRKGELTALLWSDLDITDKTISVSKQCVKNPNGELTPSRPKTETSVRSSFALSAHFRVWVRVWVNFDPHPDPQIKSAKK